MLKNPRKTEYNTQIQDLNQHSKKLMKKKLSRKYIDLRSRMGCMICECAPENPCDSVCCDFYF